MLDRIIKSERRHKYKRLRKLRRARDMASKYSKHNLPLSKVYDFVRFDRMDECFFTSHLAKHILERQLYVAGIRPPKPPTSRSNVVKSKLK